MALATQHRLPAKIFRQVLTQGKTVQDSFFFFKILPNQLGVVRVGMGVPVRLVPSAVDRVATRRRIAQEIEPVVKDAAVGYDIVIMVKKHRGEQPPGQLRRMFEKIISQS